MSTPDWTRELERCKFTRHFAVGGTDRGEQCLLPTGHTEPHRYVGSTHDVLGNSMTLWEARRLFLQCVCGYREGRSVMVARSYVEEKVNFCFSADDIWTLRSVLDDERRAEFDAKLLEWGDEHGL